VRVLDQLISLPLLNLAIPIFFLTIFFEMIAVRFFNARGTNGLADDGVSIFLGLVSAVTNGATAFITAGALLWAAQYQLFEIETTLLALVACFMLDDLRFYTHHRIAHRVRWVWALHVVHHSSQRLSYAVALRQPWTKHFTGTMMLKIPIVLIGFDPLLIIFCGAVNTIYQFFLHTEMVNKLPRWFEFIFNTPSHHRVHHAKDPKYLDANYAGTLIIWDRLLGTFIEEDPEERPNYGLVKDFETLNPFTIVTTEYFSVFRDMFQRGLTMTQRLAYLLAPPGWSHDGSRQTSADIKREAGILPAKPLEPAE
jgi:sterol desaturase/sphingolipid hydroxylase (fatty acid hydroxylase superfamily)